MLKKIKKFDIFVNNLELIDRIIFEYKNKMIELEEDSKRYIRKNKIKSVLGVILCFIAFLITICLSISMNNTSHGILVFITGIGICIFLVMFMFVLPTTKPNEYLNEKLMLQGQVNYMYANKEEIKTLLENKDKLYDCYLSNCPNGYLFKYAFLSMDEDGQEIIIEKDTFINDIKILEKGKDLTFSFEEDDKHLVAYRVILETPYEIYVNIAS